jgi:multidrug efflux pump subunit AcrA (membrane-fusion protein)
MTEGRVRGAWAQSDTLPMPQTTPLLARAVLLLAGAVAAFLLFGFWIGGRSKPTEYLTAPVERRAITAAVEATGTVNP